MSLMKERRPCRRNVRSRFLPTQSGSTSATFPSGNRNPRHAHFEMAFMLEEVEVTQMLDLRVVNRVLPRRVGMGKSAARHKIDSNRQPSLACIERDGLHEPRRLDAKSCLKQLVGHERCCPHPPSRPIGRSDRATAQSSGRRVNLWI